MTSITIDTQDTEQASSILEISSTSQDDLYNTIRKHVTAIAPLLIPDEKYTLQSICGPDFWSSLSDGQRIEAGRYMADMVRKRLVPYEYAGRLSNNHSVYRIF